MKMPVIGLDLGSRRTKAVLLEDASIKETAVFEPWGLNKAPVLEWLEKTCKTYNTESLPVGTTGYGRKSAAEACRGNPITEIRAFALGAELLAPGLRTLIDVGGQDAKVMHLDAAGKVADFEMNDRCAAGTGKFFELVADVLGIPFLQLSDLALGASECAPITSTCAVFAESEIISRLADGTNRAALAKGVFKSVAERLYAMLQRTGYEKPALLAGGGASNALAREISELLGFSVELHEFGSFFGAAGAALHASNQI